MIFAALTLATTLFVPAFTAYSEPNDEGIPISRAGAGPWKDAKQELLWIGELQQGNLSLELKGGLASRRYTVQIGHDRETISGTQIAQFNIRQPGYKTISVRVQPVAALIDNGTINGLQLTGSSLVGARFNLKERRNCASVHLKYPLEQTEQAEWFYNEVRPKTDPKYTYYEACGWHRGYFGIQVNSDHERRIIFSVWDAGKEAVDRNKVGDDNKVKLLKKGDGVFAGDFGNEGTGGHSHMIYNWKTNAVHRFLVHAQPSGDATIYTGYYYFNEKKAWGLIASFRAPKDGSYMKGLYSFNENFGGSNGDLQRMAEFGPVFVAGHNGLWKEHIEAQFSCDATGRSDRFDYAAGPKGDHWFLSNGGAFANGVKFGDKFSRLNSPSKPPKEFPVD